MHLTTPPADFKPYYYSDHSHPNLKITVSLGVIQSKPQMWSSYDRIWLSGPYKQEIWIFIFNLKPPTADAIRRMVQNA
jgi:hypothetical protein